MEASSKSPERCKFEWHKQRSAANCSKSGKSSAENSGIEVLARAKHHIEGQRMESVAAGRRQYAAEFATSPESTPHGSFAWIGLKSSLSMTTPSQTCSSDQGISHRMSAAAKSHSALQMEMSASLLKHVHELHAESLRKCAEFESSLPAIEYEEDKLRIWLEVHDTGPWMAWAEELEKTPLTEAETRNGSADRLADATIDELVVFNKLEVRNSVSIIKAQIKRKAGRLNWLRSRADNYKARLHSRWLQAKVCIVLARKSGEHFNRWKQEYKMMLDEMNVSATTELETLRLKHQQQNEELKKRQEEEETQLQAMMEAIKSSQGQA